MFESGKEITTLPGTSERFVLHRYREELGKDYKRITLYLCCGSDIKISNRVDEIYPSDDIDSSETEHNTFTSYTSQVSPLLASKKQRSEGSHIIVSSAELQACLNLQPSFYLIEPITEADWNETTSITNIADHPIIQKKKDDDIDIEDYGDHEVSSFFLNYNVLQSTIGASSDTNETVSELTEEQILEISKLSQIFHETAQGKTYNLVLVHRNKNRFWNTLFRNELCLLESQQSKVQFLRLSIMLFSQVPSMIFGSPLECLFTADPSSCINKRYFLEQLCAVSILCISRGPECVHPALVEAIFDRVIGETISFGGDIYLHNT